MQFIDIKSDSSLFVRFSPAGCILLLVYVDDIVITGSSTTEVNVVIYQLQCFFALKDLGQLDFLLGISVKSTPTGLHLSQEKYASDLLKKLRMQDAKSLPTPISASTVLSAQKGSPFEDPSLYRSTVGALQYMCIARPDLAFAVNKVCQYMYNPLDDHWSAVKCVLRYLRGTLSYGIQFIKSSNVSLTAYCDAD